MAQMLYEMQQLTAKTLEPTRELHSNAAAKKSTKHEEAGCKTS
jgi:hypothetical protein